jgi:hypothetical protein
MQLLLLRKHFFGARCTIAGSYDAPPSLYGTILGLKSVSVKTAATVKQVTVLTYQSCLGETRRGR